MINKSASKIRTAAILGTILIITFISYLPALKGEFLLWDDDVHVFDNITIRGLDFEHIQDMFTTTVNEIYIPLTSLSFAIEYHFFGYNPFIYHLDNILLHLLVVILVFLLGQRLGLSEAAAGIAALIFGIHPIHVESVAWITERKDVLFSVFYLLALLSYVTYIEKGVRRFLILTTIYGILSMLAKPMAISLPLVLFLLDWFKQRPLSYKNFIEKVPLGLILAILAWITYILNTVPSGNNFNDLIEGILIWSWTFVFYLREFFFPVFFVPVHSLSKPVALAQPDYLLSALIVVLTIFAVIRFIRYRWFTFSAFFYLFTIFIILRFSDVSATLGSSVVADRFMYIPSVGFCLAIGFALERIIFNKKAELKIRLWKNFIVVGLLGVFTFFSWTTYQQSRVWANSISLWQYQLKYFPNNAIALNNMATALGRQKEFKNAEKEYRQIMGLKLAGVKDHLSGQSAQSIRKIDYLISLYQRAIESNPGFPDVRYNLGNLYAAVGRFPEAVMAYKDALKINPRFKDAHMGLGDVYAQLGDAERAVFAYEQALRLYPEDQDVHVNVIRAYTKAIKQSPGITLYDKARSNALGLYSAIVNKDHPRASSYFSLGNLYTENGDPGMALLAYRRALELNPGHVATLYNLGNLYKDQGRLEDALVFYRKALEINPRMSDAYLNMGIISGKQNDHILEKSYYQKALKADPRNGRAYFNLAFLEEMSGNMEEAVKLYQKSIEADPDNAEGYYNLGNLYAKLNKNQEALDAYRNAVSQDSRHVDARVNLSILSFQSGDFTNAVKYCDEAVALGYEAPEGYLNALAPHRKLAVSNDASVDSGVK